MTAPTFTAGQRDSLRDLGVTPAQIEELHAVLPVVAGHIASGISVAAVRESSGELVAALRQVLRIAGCDSTDRTADRDVAQRLAFEASRAGQVMQLQAFIDVLPTVLHLAGQVAQAAPETGTQQRGMAWPAGVFETILNALATPPDEASAVLAARARPARGHRATDNPFPEIARRCYEAATGVARAPDLRALWDAWRKAPMGGVLVTAARQHGHARSKS